MIWEELLFLKKFGAHYVFEKETRLKFLLTEKEKSYSRNTRLGLFAKQYADSLAQTTGHIIAISDKDQFVAASGSMKRELLSKSITPELEQVINERENILASKDDKNFVRIVADDDTDYSYQVIWPIISEGDAIGSVVLLSKDPKVKFGDVETKLASTAAYFLGRQMEQ